MSKAKTGTRCLALGLTVGQVVTTQEKFLREMCGSSHLLMGMGSFQYFVAKSWAPSFAHVVPILHSHPLSTACPSEPTLYPVPRGKAAGKHIPTATSNAREAMGIVSLMQVPGKRGRHGGLSGSPRTILCVAVEGSEAHLWTWHSCLLPGSGKALSFCQKVSPSRMGEGREWSHSCTLRACMQALRMRWQTSSFVEGPSILWAAHLQRGTSWDLLSLWPPQTLVSSAPEAPRFRLAGPAVCHRQDGQPQSRVTFQRHQDLFNFQNSPLSILIRGEPVPSWEGCLASFPEF